MYVHQNSNMWHFLGIPSEVGGPHAMGYWIQIDKYLAQYYIHVYQVQSYGATLEFRINVHYVYSFFRKFSTLYALIRVYTFIKYKKKGPTYTFIPAYTIILFTFYL